MNIEMNNERRRSLKEAASLSRRRPKTSKRPMTGVRKGVIEYSTKVRFEYQNKSLFKK